jgi:hypothetical protein
MSIAVDASSTLVLDIVGQVCQVGSSTAQLVFTGSYVSDAASTGTVADADGIGTVSIVTPSGPPGTGSNMKVSLVGQLKVRVLARADRPAIGRVAAQDKAHMSRKNRTDRLFQQRQSIIVSGVWPTRSRSTVRSWTSTRTTWMRSRGSRCSAISGAARRKHWHSFAG